MKKNSYIFVVVITAILFSSCENIYQYCQIYETRPINQVNLIKGDNGKLCYENNQCSIEFNFWSDGGTTDFVFYNKTDEIIYIDLVKSFYVQNGIAYDLGSTMEDTDVYSVTVKDKQIIGVPPHSRRFIRTHKIAKELYLSCDLQRYPSSYARIDFSADNSPYRFSNIITYTVGENKQPVTVNGEFYVSSITNFAEPEITEMIKREELCENMHGLYYTKPRIELYDKVVRNNIFEKASSFYNTYSVTSNKKLYEENKYKYIYSHQYDAYYLSTPHRNGNSKKMNHKK